MFIIISLSSNVNQASRLLCYCTLLFNLLTIVKHVHSTLVSVINIYHRPVQLLGANISDRTIHPFRSKRVPSCRAPRVCLNRVYGMRLGL